MDDPNIPMEEYIRLEEEKARRRGKVYNWETAMYGKIWDNEDVHDIRFVETEFPAIALNDEVYSKTLSCEPTVNSENDNEKVNMPSLPSPEPTVSCFDDLDFFNDLENEFPAIVYNDAQTSKLEDLDYFKDFENEFPAIVYNDAQTSKSDFSTEPVLNPQHIDEFDLKSETSLSECDEEEQNVLNFNDLFPFNVIYPNDSKSDKDNDDDKIDIEHSSGDLSVKPLPDVINTDVGAYAHGSNKLLETRLNYFSGSRETNLYTISFDDMLKTSPICLLSQASKTKSWLWHRQLSHLNFSNLNKLAKDDLARGIPRLKFQKDHLFLRTKDEAPEAIIKCIKNIQVRLNAIVRNVRTDNGTEFVNQILREFYVNVGISHQTSVARTPQQNGVVERQNQTLVEAARTRLVPNPIPQQPCIPPPRDDWDCFLQPMFDEYFTSSSIVVSPVQEATALRGFGESPKTSSFHDDPLHESLHEDSTSQGSSSNVRQTHTPFEHHGKWTKDHPIANVIGNSHSPFQVIIKRKGGKPVDATLYRGMIGSLMFLAIQQDLGLNSAG
ncbi:putative reverse transcriptase domain-containing protein [Tanacetum coccineum]